MSRTPTLTGPERSQVRRKPIPGYKLPGFERYSLRFALYVIAFCTFLRANSINLSDEATGLQLYRNANAIMFVLCVAALACSARKDTDHRVVSFGGPDGVIDRGGG